GLPLALPKPVKQSELLRAIQSALGCKIVDAKGRGLPVPGLPAEPDREGLWGRPLRILLAEDNVVNQQVTLLTLEKQGHQGRVVGNGREALAALEEQPFDLILMDVQMPELDGLAAAAAIRRREEAAGGHVPIIALTAHAMKGDRERCLAAGMDDYVSKPIHEEELR